VRRALEALEPRSGPAAWAFEFALFVFKLGWACLFGALMLALLLATHLFYPAAAPIARYDVLMLAAIAIQLAMLGLRLESWEEAKVIAAFHLVGTVMELFKTAQGSWIYPEPALLKIGAVPLFSGFMYAAVGSFIARIWRIFDFRFDRYPPFWATAALAVAIYANFFLHNWLPDVRVAMFIATALLWGRTILWFRPGRVHRPMPLLVGFALVALFIWFAENLGTFSRAWLYPDQRDGWAFVSPGKLGAWFLLMIISFVLVSAMHRTRPVRVGGGNRTAEEGSA
jgi:uncharacterized membrane protein YoaT (DUF817 family)